MAYLGCVWQMWISSDSLTFTIWHGVSVALRCMMAFVIGNVPLTVILNAVHGVGVSVRVFSSPHPEELETFMALELASGLGVVAVSALVDSMYRREMRATVEASLASESEHTAKELLSLVCDAVVALDDRLRIKHRSPALEALLFMNTAHGLCGVDFGELVCDGDRFEAFMADPGRVQCLHVTLRDASGHAVGAQLFRSRLLGLGGQISHLLGIREDEDTVHSRQLPANLLGENVLFDTWPPSVLEHRTSCGSETSFSSVFSESAEHAFIVDAASPRLVMLSCTSSFTSLIGPVHNGDMLDWVAGHDTRSLLGMITGASLGAAPGATQMTFKLPHGQHSGQLRAICEASLVNEDSEDGRVRVKVILTDVQVGRRRRSRASDQGNGRGQIRRQSL
eukprot:CAMPEP_0194541304 /NCGR_PEP_ID=MMETSP0253-20130528/81981_1 /TAXON_ID=2966 /ORGANISM="Noctiluca scintillans" /LENGTH=393 /DNA_ID=CAMNT_0039387777 /DNA_START=35 /DNA_END=1213 /DNA_ORIENTATION=-